MKRSFCPNFQFARNNQINLNGEWDFTIKSDVEKSYKINVPFCPEAALSGVGIKGFIKECAYERKFTAPQRALDERVIIHFGAVDHEAYVYINERYVGSHQGGYTPFSFDITNFLKHGENTVKMKVYDDPHSNIPTGKQSAKETSYGCFYTRCTGIWQTVWMEVVPKDHIVFVKYFPRVDTVSVDMEIGVCDAGDIEVTVFYEGRQVGYCKSQIECKRTLRVALSEKQLWEIGNGRLYDVVIRYGQDEVKSYFGLREVKFDGRKFMLNGKSVFQRLVLDQGYYPDGVYTATDERMLKDIQSVLDLGFNGIRLHQKVFDPTYLYYCDKLGVMVWGEFPSWGVRYYDTSALGRLIQEWTETVERDFNHPSIVTWCPLNETWKDLDDARKSRDVRVIDAIYVLTKALDKTRPCVDVSGGYHGHETDLYDFHCYEDIEDLKKYLQRFTDEDILDVPLLYDETENLKYPSGYPVMISEFGGIRFATKGEELSSVSTVNEGAVLSTTDWGYGDSISDENVFVEKYRQLVSLIYACEKLSGSCYTQLYDIEQEKNGFFRYDRTPKFSAAALREIRECNQMLAAIEKL